MDHTAEEWRRHPVHVHYEISSWGRVRSVDRIVEFVHYGKISRRPYMGKILKGWINPRDYMVVSIRGSDRKNNVRTVHTLVCEAFHGLRPSPEHITRHLNGNSLDNRASNLRWGNFHENNRDTVDHGHHRNAAKTHCKHGHEFTPENTAIRTFRDRRDRRDCLTCLRKKNSEYYGKNRERRKAQQRAYLARKAAKRNAS